MNTPTPETLSRAFDAACEALGSSSEWCPPGKPVTNEYKRCADCWRRYLLAQAEQERNEG